MHYYKRNLGDYAKKAGRLSMLQHGSYTLLIDACYDREQFPTLEEAIEWTWASTNEEIEAVTFVLRKFFTLENGVYVQKRIQEEITEYHGKSEANRRIAIDREAKRKENSTNRAKDNTNRVPDVDEPPPNQEPLTINQEPLTINQEPLTINPIKNISPLSSLMALGISKKSAQDWLKVRKSKKLVLTDDAIDLFKAECAKAKLTPAETVKICNQESWGGFKAEWLNKQGKVTQFQTKAERIDANNERAANEFINSSNEKTIEGEIIHA